ncbi:ABC transporter [Lacticaseibacillus rhamnosus Lc 705]|nr:ABC transporter [Lacticaseibacillus rhamnosus Lc 705]
MLTVKNLTVAYADTPVFADVAVHFNAGKITGIIGPNGAGKSTLIKAILGLIKVQSGKVDFSGHTLKEVQQAIAYVEQRKDLDLTFPINVLDLVLTGTYGRLGLLKSPGKKSVRRHLKRWNKSGWRISPNARSVSYQAASYSACLWRVPLCSRLTS